MYVSAEEFFAEFNSKLANRYVSSQYRSNPFRASSAGNCARQLGYVKLYPEAGQDTDTTVDIQFQTLLELGNQLHDTERQLYKELGYNVHSEEMSVSYDITMDDMTELTIKGKIDGIITVGNEDVLFDIKTAGDGPFKQVVGMGLPYAYKCQASVYLAALNKTRMFFIYYNKNNSQRHILEYIQDPNILASVHKRFSSVYNCTSEETLPDREFIPYRKREKGKLTDTLVLDAHCARCLFREKCYPGFELNDKQTHLVMDIHDYEGKFFTKPVKTRQSD